MCQSGIMKRRCEDPLISQTLGFDTYRMGNCIKTDNESKYKIEELTKGKICHHCREKNGRGLAVF